jgi:hypothetical protein
LAALVLAASFIYWLFASGTIVALTQPLADWFVQQLRLGGPSS